MGRALGVNDSTSASKFIPFNYLSSVVTQKIFVAPIPCVVTAINGVTRVAGSGGACTAKLYKAASGVAVASGTLLHTGSFDLVGTADINQPLTLATDPNALILQPGDSIGIAITGTPTSAVGNVTVTVEPLV